MITNVMNAGQWGHLEERAPARARRRARRGRRRGTPPALRRVAAARRPRRGGRGADAGGDPPRLRRRAHHRIGRAQHEQGDAGRRALLGCREQSYSCAAPPWGELIAVNANTGDIAWRVPLGEFPELEAKGIKTGQPSLGGGMTTAGNLVFIGATIDGIFRAFDARNGRELWRDKLEAPAHSIPGHLHGQGRQAVHRRAGGRRRLPAQSDGGYGDRVRVA